MRFIVDECTGPSVAKYLKNKGYDVFSVFDNARGESDYWILRKAVKEKWIIITNDKGFGEKVFREKLKHKGLILLRLRNETPKNKIAILDNFLTTYDKEIEDSFIVIAENIIRAQK